MSVRADGAIRVARLVTRADDHSSLLLGIVWMEAGEVAAWSFEDADPGLEGVKYWGAVDEVYLVLDGGLKVSWGDQVEECSRGEAFYFAPGFRYTCESLGPETARVVYAMSPAPF